MPRRRCYDSAEARPKPESGRFTSRLPTRHSFYRNSVDKFIAMANFFDIRARQAAAAAASASSSKNQVPVQDNRLQPWVEK